jgi:hypothetical protein
VIKIQTTTETIESKGGLNLAGKIVEGKNDFESIEEKRGSLFFKEALGLFAIQISQISL